MRGALGVPQRGSTGVVEERSALAGCPRVTEATDRSGPPVKRSPGLPRRRESSDPLGLHSLGDSVGGSSVRPRGRWLSREWKGGLPDRTVGADRVRATLDPTSSSPGGPSPRTYGPCAPCVTLRFWIGPPTTQEVGHESRRNCRAESDDRKHCNRPFEERSTVPASATQ